MYYTNGEGLFFFSCSTGFQLTVKIFKKKGRCEPNEVNIAINESPGREWGWGGWSFEPASIFDMELTRSYANNPSLRELIKPSRDHSKHTLTMFSLKILIFPPAMPSCNLWNSFPRRQKWISLGSPPSFAFATKLLSRWTNPYIWKTGSFASSILLSRFMKCDMARHWEHHYRF